MTRCRVSMHHLYDLLDGLIERPPNLMPVTTDKEVHIIAVPTTRIGWLLNPPRMPR